MWFFNRKYSLMESGLLKGLCDRHSHVLFGVDDGSPELEKSLAILDFMEQQGWKELWCTPHVMVDWPNTTEGLRERFAELQAAYHGGIQLHLAAEYMIDDIFEQRLEARDLLTMEDNMVLVETSTMSSGYGLEKVLDRMLSMGYRPLLAHTERFLYLSEEDLKRLSEKGVFMQLNLGSLVGYYGGHVKHRAEWLVKEGMYWAKGSDCHRLHTIQRQYSNPIIRKSVLRGVAKIEH